MVRELVIDPDSFFKEEMEQPSLLKPAVIVAIAAISSLLGTVVLFQQLLQTAESEARTGLLIGALIAVVSGFLSIFVVWLVYAGVLHAISAYFDADGQFRDTFKAVGWGFLPNIFTGIITGLAMYFAVGTLGVPQDTIAWGGLSDPFQVHPMMQMATVVGTVFTIWSGFIWMFALQHARDLHIRQAAITVSIPVFVTVVWDLATLV